MIARNSQNITTKSANCGFWTQIDALSSKFTGKMAQTLLIAAGRGLGETNLV